ncbi:hypothetical protein ACQRBF_07495 [Peptoniphilaceae bacterium SGI.131]
MCELIKIGSPFDCKYLFDLIVHRYLDKVSLLSGGDSDNLECMLLNVRDA